MGQGQDLRRFEGAVVGGRFRLERFLDEGNFGAVFRASHLAYGVELREVAIKVAKEPMEDDRARRTFGDALTMARLCGEASDATLRDRFVTVHDAGRFPEGTPLGGHPYLVMELVRGGSVKSLLRAGSFPLKRTIEYFDQILDALAFMHGDGRDRRPIVHRDLKPANVLVARRDGVPDVVKVTDFGLVVEVDVLLGWVESGGDLAYLAPESFDRDICSFQSDVYMLGLLCYEMLAGRNPFDDVGRDLRGKAREDRVELRRLHFAAREAERFPVLDTHEELARRPALTRVIRTALAMDMNARTYRNAGELRAAWREAQGRGVAAPAAEAARTPWAEAARLAREAKSYLQLGDSERGHAKLTLAVAINRDGAQVPDAMASGQTYLLEVERLIGARQLEEALRMAQEGYRRRRCRSTCLAYARAFESHRSPLAARFETEAETCADRE